MANYSPSVDGHLFDRLWINLTEMLRWQTPSSKNLAFFGEERRYHRFRRALKPKGQQEITR